MMSSESDYRHAEPWQESGDDSSKPPTRPSSRRQSRTPLSLRKRRRLESVDPSRIRKYYLEGKYNDAYRTLFNEDVSRAAARFEVNDTVQHQTTQIGASTWSAKEQAALFAALERLGRDNVPGIAKAIGTKSIPETHELLLVLQDAATKQSDAKLTLRDIPAAIEVGNDCNEQLDLAGEALAWYQESFEASQEQEKFGDYWLITPAVAAKIEDAIDPGRPRTASSPPASEPDLPHQGAKGGKVVAGACTSCKQFKQKCDRGTPCSNCVRRKTAACVYKQEPTKSNSQHHAKVETANPNILEDIPEAKLLQPETMLMLSKTLFMNRSPTIPSPWPHWSEYTSEIAEEPAIYRSAFNDLHTLVVSVTRRLMQTAITQATSRLRSQRRRVSNKGLLPLVRRRDVFAAIDIVGMERNGKGRWRGAARRCAVQVFEGRNKQNQHGKIRREVPWDEVEQIMSTTEPSMEPFTTDAETSGNDASAFKSRAARSGTPLPIEQLVLSDSDDESVLDGEFTGHRSESDESVLDELRQHSTRPPTQSRDLFGRYTSVPPTTATKELAPQLNTLEQFDREASRQEEQALWQLLGLEPPAKDKVESDEADEEAYMGDSEKVITEPSGWRTWTDYRADWEEFHTLVPDSKFIVNQKPGSPKPAAHTSISRQTETLSDNNTDTSSVGGSRRRKQRASQGVELRAHGTHAYAAIQEKASHPDQEGDISDHSELEGHDSEADLPTQSIEDDGLVHNNATFEDEMDWEA